MNTKSMTLRSDSDSKKDAGGFQSLTEEDDRVENLKEEVSSLKMEIGTLQSSMA